MLERLRGHEPGSARAVKGEVSAALAEVSARLGNTPAICRKCYVHPQVLIAFEEGRLAQLDGTSPAAALRALLRPRRGHLRRAAKPVAAALAARLRAGRPRRRAALSRASPPSGRHRSAHSLPGRSAAGTD
jgi:DNA topoisomerase-1